MSSLVSVVVPVHNLEVWVAECLESILRQDVDLEVLVVDDHSTDASYDQVAEVAARDSRVKLHRATARGGGSARNQAVALATGKYLVFADGDDIVPAGAYRAMVESLEGSSAEMVVAPYLKFEANRTYNPTAKWGLFDSARSVSFETTPALLYTRAIWNKMFRRDFWVANKLQFPDVSRSNDIVVSLNAYLAAKQINLISKVVYLYRVRPGSSSMTSRAAGLTGLFSYLQEEARCLELLKGTPAEAEFWRLFFNTDGWTHLQKALNSPVTKTEAEQLARLLEPFTQPASLRLNALKTDAFALAKAGYANLAALRVASPARPADLEQFANAHFGSDSKLPTLRESLVDSLVQKLEACGADGSAVELVSQVAAIVEPDRNLPVDEMRKRLAAISKIAGDAKPVVSRLEAKYATLNLLLANLNAELKPKLTFVHRATKVTATAKRNGETFRVSQLAFALPGYWDAKVEFDIAGAKHQANLALNQDTQISEHELSGVKVTNSANGRRLPTLTLSSSRLWFALKKLVKRLLA